MTTTDKVAVRPWVAARVGPEILPVRFQTIDDAAKLDLATLPDAVVIKATHGSGMTAIFTGGSPAGHRVVWDERAVVFDGSIRKVDPARLRALTDRWLATDYSHHGGERHYAGIPRRIVAEELLGSIEEPLIEYGIYCVKGNVVYAQICRGDDLYIPVDRDYRPLRIAGVTGTPPIGELPQAPRHFGRLVAIAETLARPFDSVRVDLFTTGVRIIFSELTHTTLGGLTAFDPLEFGEVFGAFWRGETEIPERFYR